MKFNHEIINSLDRVTEVIEYAQELGVFCFDFETRGADGDTSKTAALNRNTALPTMLSITLIPGYAYVIPLFHAESPFSDSDIELIFMLIEVVFSDREIIKIAHNILFDQFFCNRFGISVLKGRFVDTLKMHDLIDENAGHKLTEDLVPYYYPSFTGYGKEIDYNGPLVPLAKYAGLDTNFTFCLWLFFEDQLSSEIELYRNYRSITAPFIPAAHSAEVLGMNIDEIALNDNLEESREQLKLMDEELRSNKKIVKFENILRKRKIKDELTKYELKYKDYKERHGEEHRYTQNQLIKIAAIEAGEIEIFKGINFRSSQQMSEFLFSKNGLKLPMLVDRRSGKETPTTNKDYLKTLDHPFLDMFLMYRKMEKIISTYMMGIKKRLHHGKLHTSIKIAGTVTGRLSMADPNLQNIPRSAFTGNEAVDKAYKSIKMAFVPSNKGRVLVQADFSQMELRLIANFSGDKNMIKTYKNDKDIHSLTGSRIAGMKLKKFLKSKKFKKFRQIAKSANFGLVYAISNDGYIDYVRNQTGQLLTQQEALIHRDAIFGTYPKLLSWHKDYERRVNQHGFVKTWFGRKRRLPEIDSSENWKRNEAVRLAINSPVQGTGGEYTVFCASLFYLVFPKEMHFINTVHDSVIHDLKEEHLELYVDTVKAIAENPPVEEYFHKEWGPVKMKMDFEVSPHSWGQLEEYTN